MLQVRVKRFCDPAGNMKEVVWPPSEELLDQVPASEEQVVSSYTPLTPLQCMWHACSGRAAIPACVAVLLQGLHAHSAAAEAACMLQDLPKVGNDPHQQGTHSVGQDMSQARPLTPTKCTLPACRCPCEVWRPLKPLHA